MRSRLHERCSIMLLILFLSLAATADAVSEPPPSFLADLASQPDIALLLAALPNPQAVGETVNTKPQTLDLGGDWTATPKDNANDNANGDLNDNVNDELNSMILPDFKPTKTPFENAYVISETNTFKSKNDFNIDYFVKYSTSEMMNARSCGESGLKLKNGGVTTFCSLGSDTATDFAPQLEDPCKDAGLGCISKTVTQVKADSPGICHTFQKTTTEEANAFPVKSDWGTACRFIIYHPDCVKISGIPLRWKYDDKMTFSKDSHVVREFECKKDYIKKNNAVLKATCDRYGKTVFTEDMCEVDFGTIPFTIDGFSINAGSTDQGTDESISLGTGGSTDQSTDGSTDQGTDGSTDQGTDGSTDQGTDGSTDQGTDGSTDQGTDVSISLGTGGTTDQVTVAPISLDTGGSTDQVTDASISLGTGGSTDTETGGTGGGIGTIEKLSGEELGFNSNQFRTRAVTTTQFPYYKCPPNTINLDSKKKTSKTFFWTNNYCHFFSDNVSGYDKPGTKCTGSNYNSYDENGVIEDYKSEEFERDLTEEELRVKKCGLQCTMIAVEFVRKLSIFVDFDEDEMTDLSCYYYDNLATTLVYYNVDYFKWVNTFLGAQTTP